MGLTILFDLDDTLLSNNIDTFIPAYIQSLAACTDHVSTRLFTSSLLAASEMMVRKSQVYGTLESTFDAHFYPAIGVSKDQMRQTIDSFYLNKYPLLQPLTHSRPIIQSLVNHLISSDHKIVIATNPLFPATAIRQRLNWAGFEHLQNKFSIITSFENFHFSKPHPEYYAEILAQMAWPEQPVVMIGNSLKDDIIPADSISIPTYLLSDEKDITTPLDNPLSSHGNLENILPWLEKINDTPDNSLTLTPSGLHAALNITPAAVETLLNGLDQNDTPHVLSLLNAVINKDLCHLDGNNNDSKLPVTLAEACLLFYNTRAQLLDRFSGISDNHFLLETFANDKFLLKALLKLVN